MRLIPALAVAVLLAGCSTGPAATVTITAPVSAPPAAPSPSATVDGWDNAQAFTEAALKGDYDTAQKYVSPGGPADRYITHQRAMDEATSAAGDGPSSQATDITFDPDARTVTYTFDEDGAPTVTWKDFESDSSGLLLGWSTGKSATKLKDRLWSRSAKVSTSHVTIDLVSAYKNDTALFVVLDVHAKDRSISPDCSALLDDSKNRQRESSYCSAPEKIARGNSGYVVLEFEGAGFGGTLRYVVQDSNWNEFGVVKLRIR